MPVELAPVAVVICRIRSLRVSATMTTVARGLARGWRVMWAVVLTTLRQHTAGELDYGCDSLLNLCTRTNIHNLAVVCGLIKAEPNHAVPHNGMPLMKNTR